MQEITEAFKWLADRGFGKAPQTVQMEGSPTTGFKMVFRRWAPGTDPASLPMAEMPKSIVTSARMLEAPKNGKPAANGSNGHRTAATAPAEPCLRSLVRERTVDGKAKALPPGETNGSTN